MQAASARTGRLLAGGALVLAAAGCGVEPPDQGDAEDEALKERAGLGESGIALTVREAGDLGDVVADGDGYTLYLFTQDGTEPPFSSCVADCAEQWPPAPADGEVEGVDEGLVGQVEREDGEEQITLGGAPLYRYAGDVEPGDANGAGMDGAWFAVAPDGTRIDAPAPPPPGAPTREEGGSEWGGEPGGSPGY
ncbi:hypothetical protein [Nocardiopsis composta]|uniref:Putative lipoprotein with Yx(FWY)xxD motif n=1 Tax=Nocardiopsis composta TaxID=157465 RepID=A0A7W8QPT9_9ACTN|nr:hypothetical protein [Nocardiopsis composta]MBB5434413.1 putative lipoprotein with Yx(FWY)xxD motif [Nocardiopsis composta]